MTISRRGALLGASAAAVVAGVPGAVLGEDAALLAQVARFIEIYGRWRSAWEKWGELRLRIGTMPDCPPIIGAAFNGRWDFIKEHDDSGLYDESERLGVLVGSLANAIMETPARTFRGAIEKFHIAHLAVGSYRDDGDEGLEAYQDWKNPWMETVAVDFERLIAGMPS